jgi:CRP/FNR family cyclic AMP-dependent transcriptional regulator
MILETAIQDDATLSSALVTVFRGRFCKTLLRDRSPVRFNAGQILYDIGDSNRRMFFIQKGFVKIGTITSDGSEVIYDIRKAGDVVGELCVLRSSRRDRAVSLELADVIDVSYGEVMSTLAAQPELLSKLIEIFCDCLGDAYDQITNLATQDLTGRVVQVLVNLGIKLGNPNVDPVSIPAYLTQEEISQMVGARRERVCTILNSLRRRGLVDYSSRGHLILHITPLRNLIP